MKPDDKNPGSPKPAGKNTVDTRVKEKGPKRRRWPGVMAKLLTLSLFAGIGGAGYLLWDQVGNLGEAIDSEVDERRTLASRQEREDSQLRSGLNRLKDSLATAEETGREVAQSVEHLTAQVADWNAGFESNLGQLSEGQRSVEAALASLRQLAADQGSALGVIEGRVAANETGIAAASSATEATLAEFAGGLEAQRAELAGLAESQAASAGTLAAANELIARLEAQYAAVSEELAAVRSAYGEQQAQIAELDGAVTEVRAGLATVAQATSEEATADGPAEPEVVASADAGSAPADDPALEVFSASTSATAAE